MEQSAREVAAASARVIDAKVDTGLPPRPVEPTPRKIITSRVIEESGEKETIQ
jgi:hypothetical protein